MPGDLDFTGLSDIKARNPAKKGWEPLRQVDLGYGKVLAFDQSLTATGVVVVDNHPVTGCTVSFVAKWSFLPGEKGMEVGLRRGQGIFSNAKDMMRRASVLGWDIAHETPPTPGKVKGSGISSGQAAQCLWNAAEEVGVTMVMLGAQPAKALVCGKANAEKAVAHAALQEIVFPWINNSEAVTNEATRDALMVGLLHLSRKSR